MPKPKSEPKYTGILAEPIDKEIRWKSNTGKGVDAFNEAYLARFWAVLAHYHIDVRSDNVWLQLADALLRAHVPAFQLPKFETRGRRRRGPDTNEPDTNEPVINEFALNWQIYRDVVDSVSREYTIRAACINLAKGEFYKERGLTFEAIRTRFYRSKKTFDRWPVPTSGT